MILGLGQLRLISDALKHFFANNRYLFIVDFNVIKNVISNNSNTYVCKTHQFTKDTPLKSDVNK